MWPFVIHVKRMAKLMKKSYMFTKMLKYHSLTWLLTHPNGINFSIFIKWMSILPVLGIRYGYFHFSSNFNRTICKQTV